MSKNSNANVRQGLLFLNVMLLFLKHSSAKKQCSKIKTMVLYSREKNNGFRKNNSGKWREAFATEFLFCFARVYMELNTHNG